MREEKQKMKSKLKDYKVDIFTLPYYIFALVVVLAGTFLDRIPGLGFCGGFALCTVFGILLCWIGDHLPIVRSYLGGGAFIALFGGALIAYFNVFPEKTGALVTDFVKSYDYLGFFVSALICGSILAMDRNLLIRAGVRYFIPVLAGIAGAFLLTGIVAQIGGFGWREGILFIATPIMGGGTAAGAVPMSATYEAGLSQSADYYLSIMMPAVVIGNAGAIVFAGLLNSLGKKKPEWTGNGKIMPAHGSFQPKEIVEPPVDLVGMGRGFVFAGCFFIIGRIIQNFIPSIHYYAWTIIAAAVANIFNLAPQQMKDDCRQWYNFLTKFCVPAVLFSIGYVYTNMSVIIENFNGLYLAMVLATLIGCTVATLIVSKLVGFYPIDGAITSGLCMANMGGSGDVATLGAAERMELMPFAQISSRIGGAIIIILASILCPLIGKGL